MGGWRGGVQTKVFWHQCRNINSKWWSLFQHVVRNDETQRRVTGLFYIQNCLQQGFWINALVLGCTTLPAPEYRGSRGNQIPFTAPPSNRDALRAVREFKARDAAATASLRPPVANRQSAGTHIVHTVQEISGKNDSQSHLVDHSWTKLGPLNADREVNIQIQSVAFQLINIQSKPFVWTGFGPFEVINSR